MTALPAVGDRLRLIQMSNDPHPVEAGAEGTVHGLYAFGDGTTQIQVTWDNGRGLHLIHPLDTFEVIAQAPPT